MRRGSSIYLMLTLALASVWKLSNGQSSIEWICTTAAHPWVAETTESSIDSADFTGTADVRLHVGDKFQTISGFGACFNELGWTSLGWLNEGDRSGIFRELFAPGVGANFSICRMPMGANDFSRAWYSYDETPGDFRLRNFSIGNDLQTLVPFINGARKYNPGLELWASPWSPPAWMKDNNHYACATSQPSTEKLLRNNLPEDRQGREGQDEFITKEGFFRAYALYFRRFIESYKALGIPIAAIMPQNEFNSCQPFPSCTWTASSLALFMGKYLLPEMRNTRTRVFFGTMERANTALADTVLKDPFCAGHIAGIGLQWAGKNALSSLHEKYPGLEIYQTEQECGNGKNDWEFCCYAWTLMQHYLDNGVNAYMYWNISLPNGGLSHWGWPQNSLITVDTVTRTYKYNYEYYLIKHLSHFVQPGARRIGVSGAFSDLLAFVNPDSSIAVVIRNQDSATRSLTVSVGDRVVSVVLKGNSFNTLRIVVGTRSISRSIAPIRSFPFMDTSLSFQVRIDDLVGRLTLPEKIAQMMNASPAIERLGIPAYNWWNEALHGVARSGIHATVFPQAIGLAASFDSAALYRSACFIADEARVIHERYLRKGQRDIYQGLTFWTPNINIFRDPRWGRGQETYGEDPYLTGRMGMALVRGFQGDDPHYLKIAACAKHFAIHSGPESSRHRYDAEISDYDLWDTYLPAFRDLVVGAKVQGVMCAYNSFRGQPCCGNDRLMTDILYRKWHFEGYTTSDCGAIDDFFKTHKTSPDAAAAAASAVLHGTDLECGGVFASLGDAVKRGLIGEDRIDAAVKRLFGIRFRLGMFDPPGIVPYSGLPDSLLESTDHQAQALRMARESIVLLKNEHGTLPLGRHLHKIVLIGPNADNKEVLLGNYNGEPSHIVTLYKGIKEKISGSTEIVFDKEPGYVDGDPPPAPAALAAKYGDADVILFAGGISPSLEGEEMEVSSEGFSGGDRTSIDLPAIQTTWLRALAATGKPVVLIMMTGSALAINWEAGHLPAILNAWYGGQAAGTAIADVLFGDYNPAGRLPVTFYRSVDQLPAFDDYRMEGRTYRYFKGRPLYPFGHGLSYTRFAYGPVTAVRKDGNLLLTCTVLNAGKRAGDEVTELYITHEGIPGKAPIRALQGFQRLHLDPGEERRIHFSLSPAQLSLTGEDGRRRILPGTLKLFIGGGQPAVAGFEPPGSWLTYRLKGPVILID